MQISGFLKLGVCSLAMLSALPAFGDIKSFNAAVTARDFKKATSEAATTWPTLDKSREDITLIAREFGFIAFVAGDYEAAKTYAEFAASKTADGPAAAEIMSQSTVLLRLAEYKLKPSGSTRDALYASLEARAATASYDNISFAATEALVAHDLDKGRWRDAAASTDLATKLASAGGTFYAHDRRRYELYHYVADYRTSARSEVYDSLTNLLAAVWSDAVAAPSDTSAKRFVDLFWEVWAWRTTLSAHLTSRGIRGHIRQKEQSEAAEKERWARFETDERFVRLTGGTQSEHDDEACEKTFDMRKAPDYPSSALFRGFVGSVILRADLDDSGKLHNPKILAAVPEKFFGEAVLEQVEDMKYFPGKQWSPSTCRMAQVGRIITFQFLIDR